MNKKGFTLIELMAVVVILGVIMTIGGIAVFNIISSQQQSLLEEQIKSLKDTAVTYAFSNKYVLESCGKESDVNPSNLTNSKCFRKITIKNLVDSHFFENKNDLCNLNANITIYKVNTIGTTFELKAYVPDGTCAY